jgi:hypothetical protein
MKVPFLHARKLRGGQDSNGVTAAPSGDGPASEQVSAGQVVLPLLPQRSPGTHGARAVKAEPSDADPDTLRKVIDGLNRM